MHGSDNPTHCNAVAMKKGNETVGHIPRVKSKMVHAGSHVVAGGCIDVLPSAGLRQVS